MGRVGRTAVLCLSAAALVHGAGAKPITVRFPDSGSYVVWVRSAEGAVVQAPLIVNGKSVTLTTETQSGDVLNVLDRHDVFLLRRQLTADEHTVILNGADFYPSTGGAAEVPAAAASTTTVTPAIPGSPASSPSGGPDEPKLDPYGGFGRLFGLIVGLALAGAVIWLITRLVQSRGKPLIELARRAGVDVPDPDDPIPFAPVADSPAFKPRPAIEKIPDEATSPPIIPLSRLHNLPSRGSGGAPNGLKLVAVEGVATGSVFPLGKKEMTVGRDADNEIVLADPTVSRKHARIALDLTGSFMIEDAGSANGVVINGQRVDRATLSLGDEIKLGDNYFRLEAV